MRATLCLLILVTGCGGVSDQVVQQDLGAPSSAASGRPTVGPTTRTETPRPTSVRATPDETQSGGQSVTATASARPGRQTSSPPSTPRPVPSREHGTVTVTQDNDGQTVRLSLGDRVRVRLTTGTWDPPESGNASVVVRRSSRGGYPSEEPVDALFEAVGKGSTDVTAQSDAACFHTEPRCLMPTQQWRVNVIVG